MLKKSRVGAALATTLASVALAGVSFSSLAATADQHTATADQLEGKPWLAHVVAKREDGSTVRCTGAAVTHEWVLTARRCVVGFRSFQISFPNDTYHPGQVTTAYTGVWSSKADVAVLRLGPTRPLAEYPKVTGGYAPKPGDAAVALGFDVPADPTKPEPHAVPVRVVGEGRDAEGGSGIAVDGALSDADSGGPLLVDGWIVGTSSSRTGAGPQASSTYSNLTPILNWLVQFGVKPGRNPNEPPPPPPTPETPTPTPIPLPTGTVPPATEVPAPTTEAPAPTTQAPTSDVTDDTFTVPAGEHYAAFDVLANDRVARGARVTWSGVPSGHGLFVGTGSNGTLRVYRFSAGAGSRTFSYAVTGTDGKQQRATVTLVLG